MDPVATYDILVSEESEAHERESAALDLLVWIAKGGHVNDPLAFIDRCERVLIEVLDR